MSICLPKRFVYIAKVLSYTSTRIFSKPKKIKQKQFRISFFYIAGATLPSTTITSTSYQPKPIDPLTTKIPNGEVSKWLITGLTVGGLALFGVTAFVIARCLCCCKSAKLWASSKKPDRSKINTKLNVNADNFYCLDCKGEDVIKTPAKSHIFSNVVY